MVDTFKTLGEMYRALMVVLILLLFACLYCHKTGCPFLAISRATLQSTLWKHFMDQIIRKKYIKCMLYMPPKNCGRNGVTSQNDASGFALQFDKIQTPVF